MKYKVYYQENSKLCSKIIICDSLDDIQLPKNTIKIKKEVKTKFKKIKYSFDTKVIYQIFYELDLMLDSNIDVTTSLNILRNNRKNKKHKEFLKDLSNNIKNAKGLNYDEQKFKVDYIVKSFFKIVNKNGDLNLAIKALSKLLKFQLEVKNSFKKAFFYPFVLLLTLIFSILAIFYFVLPAFEPLINSSAIKANNATVLLYALKEFLHMYIFYIILFFSMILLSLYIFYKTSDNFKYIVSKIVITKIPLFSKIVLEFELYKIFIILNILQKANYEFFDTLSSLRYLIKNKYLLDKISLIETLIKSGKSISFAFEITNLFDGFVLNLINTGEKSNNLSKVTFEIEKVYKISFENKVKSLSFWIQPIVFLLIMGLILWIIYAIFIPMWSMSDMIKF